jgi:hypothetical protein
MTCISVRRLDACIQQFDVRHNIRHFTLCHIITCQLKQIILQWWWWYVRHARSYWKCYVYEVIVCAWIYDYYWWYTYTMQVRMSQWHIGYTRILSILNMDLTGLGIYEYQVYKVSYPWTPDYQTSTTMHVSWSH